MNDEDRSRLESLFAGDPELWRLARHLVRDATTADDLLQQAWLASKASKETRVHDLRPWLGGVPRNLPRAHKRSERGRVHREGGAAKEELSPARLDELERMLEHLRASWADPDEPYRTVVRMRYI